MAGPFMGRCEGEIWGAGRQWCGHDTYEGGGGIEIPLPRGRESQKRFQNSRKIVPLESPEGKRSCWELRSSVMGQEE